MQETFSAAGALFGWLAEAYFVEKTHCGQKRACVYIQ